MVLAGLHAETDVTDTDAPLTSLPGRDTLQTDDYSGGREERYQLDRIAA
jgi:hypothetical protein